MALIKCPECQRDISSLCARCPHCGFPMAEITPAETESSTEQSLSNATDQHSKESNKRPIIAVACAVVALILIVVTTNKPMHYDAPKTTSSYSGYNNSSSQTYYEDATSVLTISNVKLSENSSYTIVTGTLTNKGRNTYKFVKLKAAFENYKGDILDTDSTYGCGDEGLAPNESTTFRMSISKNYSVSKVVVTVYDYDIA